MKSAQSSQVLFVLGMHRSGTSALCAALQSCGVSFGSDLLEPIVGVNDEGFWEAQEVVAINEALLAAAGYRWYTATAQVADIDWAAPQFGDLLRRARQWLQTAAGGERPLAVKDPRLCITLPVWLAAARELELSTALCCIQREPAQIARSLQARDDFPIGFGLGLVATYLKSVMAHAGENAVYVTYDELLERPQAVIEKVAKVVPLTVDAVGLGSALQLGLRHHERAQGEPGVLDSQASAQQAAEYFAGLDALTDTGETLNAFAGVLVEKNIALTELGQAHSQALATIDERDQQIRDFDVRLQALGQEHTRALVTIDERDQQLLDLSAVLEEHEAVLRRLTSIPLLGSLFNLVRRYAGR